jgi:nucleolar protein 56
MRAYIVTTFVGTFALDEDRKVVGFKPFPMNPKIAAEKLKYSEIENIDEEKKLMQELWKKGFKEFIFSYRKTGAKHVEPNNEMENFLKENLRKITIEKKIFKDQIEFNQFFTKVNLEATKVKIKRAVQRDSLIIQANGAIEEIDKSVNVLSERLREWYGLHFPEMDRSIEDHSKYAAIVEKFGTREGIEDDEIKTIAKESMGIELEDEDVVIVRQLADKILAIYKLRDDLAKYLDKILKKIAPNTREIAGPMLAAKLIAKAGGLDKLARSPSSTIQLLGAEKALFRFLHGKGKSPKFGIIFNHPLIQNASYDKKGKIARILAAKISMAAKIDYYSKDDRGDKLKKELEAKIKEVMKS